MELSVIYFAAVRELVGLEGETVQLESSDATVQDLVDTLLARHARLRMEGVRIAVNEEFVDFGHALKSGDVIAFIPPVSGG